MITAAIDPSISNTGHAIIDGANLIAYGHGPMRTPQAINALVDVLVAYGPDVVGIEAGYVSVNAKVGLQLAELRGALAHVLRSKGMRVEYVQPSAWRAALGLGVPKAKTPELKRRAIAWVLGAFGVVATTDEADAICLAASHVGACSQRTAVF